MYKGLKRRIFCTSVCSILLSLVFVIPAFAYHVGGYYTLSSSNGITGGYCQLTTFNYPSATVSDQTMAYVMIAPNDLPNSYKYAQVGWVTGGTDPDRKSYTDTRYFFEWSNTSTDWNRVRNTYGPAKGSKHAYKVEFNGDTVTGTEDGAFIGSHKMIWNTVTEFQYMGERYNTSRFPGRVSQHEYIDCLQYKLNGIWKSITSMTGWVKDTSGGLSTTYFNSSNNYRFDIWDTRVN